MKIYSANLVVCYKPRTSNHNQTLVGLNLKFIDQDPHYLILGEDNGVVKLSHRNV